MDTATQGRQTRHQRHEGESHEGKGADTSANTQAPKANDEPKGEVIVTPTVNVEIAGLSVALPIKFQTGHILTENQAKALDAAYQRQFANNQNASAKSRAEALAKATTAEDKAAKAPLTADQIAALYADYEPAVGGAPRLGQIERMRHDAAWRAWVALVGEHNEAIKSGETPVIVKAGPKPVTVQAPPRRAKDVSEDAHKIALEAFAQARTAFIERFLSLPEYAGRVQAQLDAILAERGAKKDTTPTVETVSAEDAI